jgi:hypothetical protein
LVISYEGFYYFFSLVYKEWRKTKIGIGITMFKGLLKPGYLRWLEENPIGKEA